MPRDDEAARYRHAADLALEQLNWCAEYLRSIHKQKLAEQVTRNSAAIRRRLSENEARESRRT